VPPKPSQLETGRLADAGTHTLTSSHTLSHMKHTQLQSLEGGSDASIATNIH